MKKTLYLTALVHNETLIHYGPILATSQDNAKIELVRQYGTNIPTEELEVFVRPF